jgi:hypothetical protein
MNLEIKQGILLVIYTKEAMNDMPNITTHAREKRLVMLELTSAAKKLLETRPLTSKACGVAMLLIIIIIIIMCVNTMQWRRILAWW